MAECDEDGHKLIADLWTWSMAQQLSQHSLTRHAFTTAILHGLRAGTRLRRACQQQS